AGASCSPNGLVGRDNTGAILSCQSGSWQGSRFKTVTRSSTGYESMVVNCNSNEQLTGGGAQCNPGSKERLKWSNPAGNGWAAACPGQGITVFAICAIY
ncbi:shufflon system plasmid conjugative transfer pilus tip adhesin PilV, partial [Klebsiella pneumoniae]